MKTARIRPMWIVPCTLAALVSAQASGQDQRRLQPQHVHPPEDARRQSLERSHSTLEQWAERLADELDHLHEDLYYERVDSGLRADAERAQEAVVHFQQVLRRNADRQHLLRDFRTMDREVHRLIDQAQSSRASWIRRSAARIEYADQQLHYHLRAPDADDGETRRELVARHAHVLEREGRQLEQYAQLLRRQRRGEAVYEAVAKFADAAEHFHDVVERGADRTHVREDFDDVDHAWHEAVDQINQSEAGIWLRRSAQRVNSVHNQLHTVLHGTAAGEPTRDARRREQPRLEFNIPGIGRIRL